MSITFSLWETDEKPAPMVKRYCRELYPSLQEEDFAEDSYVLCDEGGYYELRSAWPEANFANANARAVLALLGLPEDDYGCIQCVDISTIRQRLMKAINDDHAVARVVREPWEGNGKGAQLIEMGADAMSFRRRLGELSTVLEFAQRECLSIIWS